MKNLIDNEFKITSILVKGYYVNYLTASLVEQFKEKKVLLWQDKNLYHSCKRLQLLFGHDLIFLLEEFADEFDVLIIDKFRDNISSQDTINFIKTVSKMEKMKDKQFIFLISATTDNDITIFDLQNLKDVVLECSDNIYTFNRVKKSLFENKYQLKNIETDKELLLKEIKIGANILLEEACE